MNPKDHSVERRDFLKWIGGGAIAATATLTGCAPDSTSTASSHTLRPQGPMSYRTTPTTGDKVSLLGYGCMRWPTIVIGDNGDDEIDQDMVNQLVDVAIENGVNYFDTAPTYCKGRSEEALGIALKRHPREKFMVATKLSNHRDDANLRTREGAIALYQQSRQRLQLEVLDYYLLHGCGVGKPLALTDSDMDETFNSEGMLALRERYFDNGMVDFLMNERAEGRIRNLGWSFHGDVKVFEYMLSLHDSGRVKWDFVQIQLNYIDWKHASGWNVNAEILYGELAKRGIPAVVMEPLLGGRLSNLPQYLVNRLKTEKPNASIASWAFRYAGSFPGVLTVLSGMTYLEHLQDNLHTYSPIETLTEPEFALLEKIAELFVAYAGVPCTTCKYCMPCPFGINIPQVFLHFNKCINAGTVLANSNDANYRRARREFLIGYDRSVPKLRQASRCTGCDKCVSLCPQGIKIPAELDRIDNHVETLKRDLSK